MPQVSKTSIIRTRFAPSPTGELHIGGARTALFNYLLAKHNNGQFVLRMEDTDDERNILGHEKKLENELKHLNIFPDESFSNPGKYGPYLQSQKYDRYLEIAEKLVNEKKAYYCFCTRQELVDARAQALAKNSTPIYSKKCRFLSDDEVAKRLKNNVPFVIRLKTDIKDEYSWVDLIRGKITVPSSAISDFVLIRSNKKATYNFAVVIDDYDMRINHVLRGEEHISNTPYQIALFHALGWEKNVPAYGHISMILDKKRAKLSKRSSQEEHFLSFFREKGFPGDAVVNFLALLSWSHEEREIFKFEEIIKLFDLSEVSSSPSVFDVDKLNWISHKYFEMMDESSFLNFIKPYFTFDMGNSNDKRDLFALLHKNRITHADELNDLAQSLFIQKELESKHCLFLKKHLPLLEFVLHNFPGEKESWDLTTIRNFLKQTMEINSLKGQNFFKPLRLALSFEEEGLALHDFLHLIGRNQAFSNLKYSLKTIKNA